MVIDRLRDCCSKKGVLKNELYLNCKDFVSGNYEPGDVDYLSPTFMNVHEIEAIKDSIMFNINFFTTENKQKKNYQLDFVGDKRTLRLVGEKCVKMEKISATRIFDDLSLATGLASLAV